MLWRTPGLGTDGNRPAAQESRRRAIAALSFCSSGVITVPAADLPVVRELFEEYAASLGVDLSFQGFDRELAGLPGDYAPPGGAILVARDGGDVAAAWRCGRSEGRLRDEAAVRAAGVPGPGLGRALAEAAIAEARRLGYERMRLDTLPSMGAARALYPKLGFREIEPYRFNPIAGTQFLELEL